MYRSQKKYQTSTKDNAMKILDGAPHKLHNLESTYAESFPYPSLSSASAEFSSIGANSANEKALKAVTTALDVVDSISHDIRTIEKFIRLHIPKMEDGNNFGVTVQLALLKELSELQEACATKIDDLSGYANARAEALGKLNLPSKSETVTKSSTVSTTDGKKEEKNSEATEEKKTTNDITGPVYNSRVAAIVAADTQYYSKAQRAFQSVVTLYIAVLDFLDKNRDRIENPRGSGVVQPPFSSMY
jgi:hypothetical protein